MKKGMGIIRLLGAILAGMVATPTGETRASISVHRNKLLTNSYSGPEPRKHLNQRQKRKAIRQQPRGRKF